MNLIKFVRTIDLCNVFSYPFRNRQWAHNQYWGKSWAVLSIWTTALDCASKFNYFQWHIFAITLKKSDSKHIVSSVCVWVKCYLWGSLEARCGNISHVEGGGTRYHMWLIRMWIAGIKKNCGVCVCVTIRRNIRKPHSTAFESEFILVHGVICEHIYLCVWADRSTSFITLASGRVKG